MISASVLQEAAEIDLLRTFAGENRKSWQFIATAFKYCNIDIDRYRYIDISSQFSAAACVKPLSPLPEIDTWVLL